MIQVPSQLDFDKFEMKNRLRNKKRTLMLIKIYSEPQRYQDLISLTNLKPGSIYHHIRILDDLIEKKDHGTYFITELGKSVVEFFGLVSQSSLKPIVKPVSFEILSEDKISIIWIGYSSYILILFVLTIVTLLGLEGVALAGSAIYNVGYPESYIFDLTAILLGWIPLILMYRVLHSNTPKEYLGDTLLIRSLSMLPGAVIGVSVYLLFIFDSTPSQRTFEVLFSISMISGLIIAATGVYYFKNKTMKDSILISLMMTSVDLLLGITILLAT